MMRPRVRPFFKAESYGADGQLSVVEPCRSLSRIKRH